MAENKEKTQGELLQEQLILKPENSGITMSDEQIGKAFDFAEPYKQFLDSGKTEREVVDTAVERLEKEGFVPFDPAASYKAGDRVYRTVYNKAIVFATIGTRPLGEGVRIVASHIDSPRIDLKPRPLYEEAQLAMFKTHYYGGIRKYQWVSIPLALHGVVVKKDGTAVKVVIGEDEADPVFTINDLLPHLSREQDQRKLGEGIKGEELNVLVGSMPFRDDKASEKVKLNIMRLFHERYGIAESDFLSAELSMVPAHRAKDVGLDRSMIGAYGQDDRVCAYASLMAGIEVKHPAYTSVSMLVDKEEVGSMGPTGLESKMLEYFVEDLCANQGVPARTVFSRSEGLSADVNAAYDPTFPNVSERKNSVYIGYGVGLAKYVGARGKSGTLDASAEFVGKLRRLFDEQGIIWQIGELGKVDEGGGGTVSKFIGNLGVNVIDIGVPVLAMHSPFEVTAKTDLYNMYLGFCAFLSEQ